ncbi:MAG: GAF domain-containing protein [Chloroflexi bacterium]|jgi:GAF domain-containing protein|nr:GAF domain-containing protein [Chloroflexota bacterium]MBT3671178.1 GAF domain-containing protein [Chloroflexota bacterium]MBT4002540.1 GAF domain-containing protein [Chloroflexota bacterium]MBT4304363.1 GAF domain-containing protein [Chloroflexota bacterium]MBT4534382.1 GAF domain-containing protein [Chloroflexota bacterium]
MLSDTNTFRKLQKENIRLLDENKSLNKQLHRLQHSLQSLVKLQRSLESIQKDTNVFQLINHVLTSAMGAVDSENGSLGLLDERTGDLVFVEVLGQSRDKLLNLKLPKGQGIAHWCIKNKLPRLVENTIREPVFSPMVEKHSVLEPTSLICIPLIYNDRPLGALEVINTKNGRPFNEADKEIMILVGQLAAMIIATAEKIQD